jgi:hypothetical protein
MRRLQSAHKFFGYFIIFTVQIVITTGIMRRTGIPVGNDNKRKRDSLICTNILFFYGTLIIGEVIHQKRLRTEVKFK